MMMDRGIAGTRPDGFGVEVEEELRVSHRAGGMAAPNAPKNKAGARDPTSFVTLVWTNGVSREDFMKLFRETLQASRPHRSASSHFVDHDEGKGKSKGKGKGKGKEKRIIKGGAELDESEPWPLDPDSILDFIEHDTLLPWTPELTLFDRQKPRS
jgi:hypothetical protein